MGCWNRACKEADQKLQAMGSGGGAEDESIKQLQNFLKAGIAVNKNRLPERLLDTGNQHKKGKAGPRKQHGRHSKKGGRRNK